MESYEVAATAIGTGTLIFTYAIAIAISVVIIVAMWKMFVKAGKPGWGCLVPFYSQYCLFDIAMGNGWLFLLACIPCVNFVMLILVYLNLAKAFGKGTGFGLGLIFLSPIFMCILGFGSDQYIGPQ